MEDIFLVFALKFIQKHLKCQISFCFSLFLGKYIYAAYLGNKSALKK